MVTYVQTPDYGIYLQHVWLKKDSAAPNHKYVKRWRGPDGKWHYSYKSANEGISRNFRRKATNGRLTDFRITNPLAKTKSSMYGDKRYKVPNNTAFIYNRTTNNRKPNKRPSSQVNDAMKYDPRFENKTSSLKNDPRYKVKRVKPSVTSAMKYDPRYERKTSGINVKTDPRYSKPATKSYEDRFAAARRSYRIAAGRKKVAETIANKERAKKKSREIMRDQIIKRHAKRR